MDIGQGLAAYGAAQRYTDQANDQRAVRRDADQLRQLKEARQKLLAEAMRTENEYVEWRKQQAGQPKQDAALPTVEQKPQAPVSGLGPSSKLFDGIYDDANADFRSFPDSLRNFNPNVFGYAEGGQVQGGDVFSRVLAFAQGGVIPGDEEGPMEDMAEGGMEEPGELGAIPGRLIEGPGTGTSDSIPAMIDGQTPAALSAGEFVIPAAVVEKYGVDFFEKLIDIDSDDEAGEDMPDGDEAAFAKGGAVGKKKGKC